MTCRLATTELRRRDRNSHVDPRERRMIASANHSSHSRTPPHADIALLKFLILTNRLRHCPSFSADSNQCLGTAEPLRHPSLGIQFPNVCPSAAAYATQLDYADQIPYNSKHYNTLQKQTNHTIQCLPFNPFLDESQSNIHSSKKHYSTSEGANMTHAPATRPARTSTLSRQSTTHSFDS